ncbi:MAG TPA: hypothetical protein PK205_03690 [Promineifilum sp.]|nr:hypothetical protein [Promineifilum sp.]HRO89444.1 hypothetical protein [Promineifilum sp.]HRQ12386.1 hypothetical protein [Promineifilum sp.]
MDDFQADWMRRFSSLVAGALLFVILVAAGCSATSVVPTITPEPIVPTRTPASKPIASATETPIPPSSPTPEASPIIPTLSAERAATLSRIGLAGALADAEPAAALGLRSGHFTFWRVWDELPAVPGLTTWQTVRLGQVSEDMRWPANREVIARTLAAHPGSYWLIGNEPDVIWQDNATPEEYARAYNEIYTFIKERDPSARVSAGGIALPTPLRLAWLDEVLRIYRETYGHDLPADLWSIHLFILREERDSWGIDIPPGMDEAKGELYEIEDHGNVELVKQYVVAFRRWMAANSYADRPLAVTEFGILLPEDYGFPPEFVQNYMRQTYDYFLTATGEDGLAADDGRLVQYAFWYSLFDEGAYPTGNLYDARRGALTPLGEAFVRYIEELTP